VDDEVNGGTYARLEVEAAPGSRRIVTVGFVESADGSLLVAAGSPDARWAAALADGAEALVTTATRQFRAIATILDEDDPERSRAIRELILRYGTPSERLGHGAVFRLSPIP
jgi:hypothetical protein